MSKASGCYIPEEIPKERFEMIPVLTREGILSRYNLTVKEFTKIQDDLRGMTFRDILFHYPDGPRKAIALHTVGPRVLNKN